MNKQKCINDFQAIERKKPITTWGEIKNEKSNINISSIWTKLIQEAGRWCKHYASDLFWDFKKIDQKIENGTLETESYLFGFRECGVDHDSFIFSRYNNQIYDTASFEYRAIWRLDITVDEPKDGRTSRKVTFSLYEVQR